MDTIVVICRSVQLNNGIIQLVPLGAGYEFGGGGGGGGGGGRMHMARSLKSTLSLSLVM